MLDFNGIGIKSSEDLQEAFEIEMDAKNWADQVKWMIERWGLDSALMDDRCRIVRYRKGRSIPLKAYT